MMKRLEATCFVLVLLVCSVGVSLGQSSLFVDLRGFGHGLPVAELGDLGGGTYEWYGEVPEGQGFADVFVSVDSTGDLEITFLEYSTGTSFYASFVGTFDAGTGRSTFYDNGSTWDTDVSGLSVRVGPDSTWVTTGGEPGGDPSVVSYAEALVSAAVVVGRWLLPAMAMIVTVGGVIWLFLRIAQRVGGRNRRAA